MRTNFRRTKLDFFQVEANRLHAKTKSSDPKAKQGTITKF